MSHIKQREDIAILIPTLNEEKAISKLIKRCKHITEKVIIIDGLSTDKTIDNAKNVGAEVVYCTNKGKGKALICGLIDVIKDDSLNYIAYIDGDNTYDPFDIPLMIDLIEKNQSVDMVIGNRFPKREKGTIKLINLFGNRIFSFLISVLARQLIIDTQSGLRVFKYETAKLMTEILESRGFEIETEMIMKLVKNNVRIKEIPISYVKGDGITKLKPFRDGSKILREIGKNIFYRPK